jgi:hypothetical protein
VEARNIYRLLVLVEKLEGRRPLRRSLRWVNNIKVNLVEKGCGGIEWIDLAQDRDRRRAPINTVMNLRGSIKCWEYF